MPRTPDPDLPDRLLRTALAWLDERGAPNFSMRELAAAEGYSVTAVYRCYANRGALLKAMQLALFAGLPDALGLQRLLAVPLKEGLHALAVAFVQWGVDHPARYRFMFLNDEPDALLEGPEQALARAPLTALTALLAQAQAESTLSSDFEPAGMATWLFAGLHGLVALSLQQRLDPDVVPDVPAFVEAHAGRWLGLLFSEVSR